MTTPKGGEQRAQQGNPAPRRRKEARYLNPEHLTVAHIVAWTKIPVTLWVGDCVGICLAIADHNLIDADLTYGYYMGPADPRSPFLPPPKPWNHVQRMEFGEIDGLEPDEIAFYQTYFTLPDGRVLDPTRWTFEMVAPYIYIGPADDYEEDESSRAYIAHLEDDLRTGRRQPYNGNRQYCLHEPPRFGAMLTVRDPWFKPLFELAKLANG